MTTDTLQELIDDTVRDPVLANKILWRMHGLGLEVWDPMEPEFLESFAEFLEGKSCLATVDNLDGEGFVVEFLEKNDK